MTRNEKQIGVAVALILVLWLWRRRLTEETSVKLDFTDPILGGE